MGFSVIGTVLEVFAESLIKGDVAIFEKFFEEKLEDIGKEFIKEHLDIALPPQFSVLSRVVEAVESRGQSEFKRFFAEHIKPRGIPWLEKIQNAFTDALKSANDAMFPNGKLPQWMHADWATSRMQWISEKWRHDWRSQPRNLQGEWIPGRLPYPVGGILVMSRRMRRLMRQRRQQRKLVRRATKSLGLPPSVGKVFMSSWSQF
jgi:hypothetical protein